MNKFVNSFEFNNQEYYYYDIQKIISLYPSLKKLPNSLKLILESNIRNAKEDNINSIIDFFVKKHSFKNIDFFPNRVVLNDFIGLPAFINLASMRDYVKQKDIDTSIINPKVTVDLILDDNSELSDYNNEIRTYERDKFLKWAANSFDKLSVVPFGKGISNKINLEYLSTMISAKKIDDKIFIFPENVVGVDSQTTMINALGVLGLKRRALEIEKAIFASSISFSFPEVIGVKITGSLSQGVSILDATLSLVNILKEYNLKDKLVEFYGSGLKNILIEDRATISNLVSEFESIANYFNIDDNTISFVEQTRGVDASLIKEYYIKQGLFSHSEVEYDTDVLFDLSLVKPIVSGPKHHQEKVIVEHIPSKLTSFKNGNFVKDNDIVLAQIFISVSTATPSLLIQAGLLAKKSCTLGLKINPNIKKVFLCSSDIQKDLLIKLDLLQYLEKLGFEIRVSKDFNNIDDSLVERVVLDIEKFNLNVSSVISSTYEYFNYTHSLIKSNWTMSPALVIAYSLKGTMNFNITKEPISTDIYLSDIWPSGIEVEEYLEKIDFSLFSNIYKDVFLGNNTWQNLSYEESDVYSWNEKDTYIQPSNFVEDTFCESININEAKILALFDDNISSDYLCAVGKVSPYSPTSHYLQSKGLKPDEFNSFESRHGNSEVMVRGTLSNIRLKNRIVLPKEGGYTKDFNTFEVLPIFEFAMKMKHQEKDLVLFAGDNFGTGNSRDWASKGLKLLSVKAVVAKSFDSNFKSDLVSMGILPLEFIEDDIKTLSLKGNEQISIKTSNILLDSKINLEIKKGDEIIIISVLLKFNSLEEMKYYKAGGFFSFCCIE